MAPPSTAACPRCAAAVRPSAPWCTQCFLDLRTPVPVPAAAPVPAVLVPAAAPVPAAPEPVRAAAGWPCAGCGTVVDWDSALCPPCGLAFLSGLRTSEQPLLVLPGVGDVGRLDRPARLGLAVAVVLTALLAVAVLTAVWS